MIIWSGWGFLVLAIFLGIGVTIESMVKSEFGEEYYKSHGWPGFLIGFLSATLIGFIGRWVNRRKIQETLDPQTGNIILNRKGGGHTFFFIPMEYWAVIVLVFGFYSLFRDR